MSYGSKLHISPTNCHLLAVQQVIQNRLSLWETLWIIFWGESWACNINEHTAESFVNTMVMEKANNYFKLLCIIPNEWRNMASFFLFVLFYFELPDFESWPHEVSNHWSHKDPSLVFLFQLYANELTAYKLVGEPMTIHCIFILSWINSCLNQSP